MIAQRARTGRLDWSRIRSINAPFRALGVYERPNTEVIKMMVDMYPDNPLVNAHAERLSEKRNHVLRGGGEQYQEYDQKDMSSFAPEGYMGTTKIGRAYAQSILPYLPSKLLNTIYKETHMEIDIKSCFCTMLTQAFAEVDTPVMDLYVQNPQVVYDRLGMDKRVAKKLINSMICAYPNIGEDPTIGNWAELSRNELVQAMKFEVGKWATALRERYPTFHAMVDAKCKAENKTRHVDGTALFYLASDMEHSVMREAARHLFPNQEALQNVVWKFDGMIVPKGAVSGKPHEQIANDLQNRVKEKLLLDIEFCIRDLHENSLGICLGPDERDRENGEDAYARWKGRFEKRFARVSTPPVFMMFARGGKTWYDLKKADFEHVTMEQPKEFVKKWLDDPDKRHYEGRVFAPPPSTLEDGFLNLYRGIAAAEILPNEDPVDITLYLNHVDRLMGMNKENSAYMHKLIAQKIQMPGLKWRVMPIVMSAQGVGKDIWFDFLASVIGKEQCIKDDGIHKFAGTNSHALEGKLLCCFQEMGYKETKEHEEALKAMITNDTIQIQKKYVNCFITQNVVDFIGFTNQFNAINVSADDRRYFIVVSDSTYAQDNNYMLPLLAFFGDDRNKRAVYDYYMGIDLNGFSSSADRPHTEAHRELVETSLSHADRFLKAKLPIWRQMARDQDRNGPPRHWDFNMMQGEVLRIKSSVVVDDWMDYAKDMGVTNADKKASMIQYLGRQIRELNARSDAFKTGDQKIVDKYRGKGSQFHDIDVRGIKAYLAKIFNEEEEEEEEAPRRIPAERSLHNSPPGSRYRYEIREGADIVMVTDDLEEANKELGEAYVVTRFDEERGEHVQFLIHQRRNNMEIPLGTEYIGEGGKQRLEMQFPYYIRNRTV